MKRVPKQKWSFVVLRGADKTVKQFHVSKRSVFAAPTAAVLAVSGCIAGLQIKASYELNHLEEQMSQQDAVFSQTVTDKNQAIISLQQEIIALSEQTLEMKEKIDDLQQLELKLKQFIDNYGSSIDTSSHFTPSQDNIRTVKILSSSTTSTKISTNLQQSKQFALLAKNTTLHLSALEGIVNTMEQSMALTLQLAQSTRSSVDAYPSEWPTLSKMLTSGFGYRRDPITGRTAFHAGVDINGNIGDPIFSAADGIVSDTGSDSSLGKYIVIDHLGGLQSAYMHLNKIEAKEGDIVVKGEKIGLLGSSGRSTGPHLHFQIMQKNEPVNPLPFLSILKED